MDKLKGLINVQGRTRIIYDENGEHIQAGDEIQKYWIASF